MACSSGTCCRTWARWLWRPCRSSLAQLYAWLNGIRLGQAAIGHHTVAGTFYTGVLALAALLLFNTLTPVYTGRDVLLPVLLFFTLGLCGLALTSLRRLRAQQRTVTLTQVALTRYWLATALAVIALLIFVGLAMAQIPRPRGGVQLAALLELVLYVALLSVALLVTPVMLLVVTLLAPVLARLSGVIVALLAAFERLGSLLRT